MKSRADKKPRPPLDAEALQRLALFYVGRYATTRAKLKSYLARKVRERGFEGTGPDLDALAERLSGLGYIDDRAFASARAASLGRRGYGERRIGLALGAAGISEVDSDEARQTARDNALAAALRFAERKRIGPYAERELDQKAREKAFAAMMRAGHPIDVTRQVLKLSPGEFPESDAP